MKLVVVAAFSFLLYSCARPSSALPVLFDVRGFQLIAQDGQPFDSKTLAGKIWVADFIYTTCPGPCPRMTSQMREVQDAVAKLSDVDLVSFTVDPARDTPDVLAGYAQAHDATPGRWYFLTGSRAALQTLDRDVFKLGNLDASLESQHALRAGGPARAHTWLLRNVGTGRDSASDRRHPSAGTGTILNGHP